ncbi:16S rRNA (adenine(1518)-N(6)/adenine(1519)-N(6))-dimethyltransferase RsmA [Pelomicrobium methylotrophicum]|uniref:Ribosomal RNA small subunit methyltransferase A n=1 Tax=Pelomicrobium methylotrophicum TaxID=2602750 RepID=A0A5C7EQZ6_9PROT|nr:16S rRNA (adenine(1518)-N(6)/adenine(1519)-N(6))-dimethyltransferase RsmA [Pelomicrobium methylotrophicum]TXF11005.1 16S rRNA (adenine(1518)-N(6)/adenine(1519)-N(6))-dimethyltransferase RsmA [Pelomicrobium methylotrophicum]
MHIPRKRFGQHFLVEPRVIARIVEAVEPRPGERVVEIGPGHGALTAPLLERAGHLTVVEIDRDLAAALRARYPEEQLAVHCADALRFDFGALGAGLRLVGNLPYNVSTPLLFHLERFASQVRDMHFMLQKEVVDRMAAGAGTAHYGRLSVALQYRFRIERLFDVAPHAFKPAPQVHSAFVRLVPHPCLPHPARSEALFRKMVTAAFSQRRKMLRNALGAFLKEADWAALGIDPRLRPEMLGVDAFVAAANFVAERWDVAGAATPSDERAGKVRR